MFHELEDQNLSLIQNGQDMEENIDEIKSQANVSPAFWLIFDARLKMIIGGDTEQSSSGRRRPPLSESLSPSFLSL